MRISTVYKLINDIDDLGYIGSTTCGLSKRIGDHRYKVRLGNQSKLYNHGELTEESFSELGLVLGFMGLGLRWSWS